MEIIKNKQQEEAIARLQIMQEQGLHPQVLKDFKQGKVNISKRVNIGATGAFGKLCWIEEDTEIAEAIKEFELERNVIVYHATHERVEGIGDILDLFIVTQNEDDWEQDRIDLRDGYSLVYAMNLSVPYFSEFGSIGYGVAGGGLIRVC